MKLIERFMKKKQVIGDAGVHEKSNPVDFFIILGCIVIIVSLTYLTIMAYIA